MSDKIDMPPQLLMLDAGDHFTAWRLELTTIRVLNAKTMTQAVASALPPGTAAVVVVTDDGVEQRHNLSAGAVASLVRQLQATLEPKP